MVPYLQHLSNCIENVIDEAIYHTIVCHRTVAHYEIRLLFGNNFDAFFDHIAVEIADQIAK